MDDAIRISVTKDHEPFCRSSEELRRRSFDTLKTAVPSQRHDVHVVLKPWREAVPTGEAGTKG